MPTQFTTRTKNRYPQAGDVPVVHTDIENLAKDVDDAALWSQGPISNRPVSTAPSPGIDGRWYRSTDQGPGNQGLIYVDAGTSWDNVAKYAHLADTYANRPAASADLNGLRFFATDKKMEWQCIASAWVLVAAYPVDSLTMPASPVDGQLWRFDMHAWFAANVGANPATRLNQLYWIFRYNSTQGAWYLQGGLPFIDRQDAIYNLVAGTAWQGQAMGPFFYPPFAGDYYFRWGAKLYPGGGSGHNVQVAWTTAASYPNGSVPYLSSNSGASNYAWAGAQEYVFYSVPIFSVTNGIMRMVYTQSFGSSAAEWRWASVLPVRVYP